MTIAASLDYPIDGQTVGRVVPILGWALFDEHPASIIEVFVNDRAAVRARRGDYRVDLVGATEAALADELIAGFSEIIALDDLAVSGAEVTIQVRATGVDGTLWEPAPVTVTVADLPEPGELRFVNPFQAASAPPDRPDDDGRPRVCAFTHSLRLGGGELYLQELLLRLARSEACTILVVAPEDGPLRAELEAAGIHVHLGGHVPIEPRAYAARLAELETLLLSWRCDVVIVNTLGSFGPVDAALAIDLPVIWTIHESFPVDVFIDINWGDHLRPEMRARLFHTLEHADVVVFEAAATKALFESQVPGMHARHIRYGIDQSAITAYEADHPRDTLRDDMGFAPTDRVLLCMGIFQDRKSQLALVHAFAPLAARYPDARLVLVGNHPSDYARAVGKAVSDLGLAASVRIVDVHPDTYRWYRVADVLVSASDTESLPRSILESMTFGVPVAAAAVFGVPEVVTDGATGWLFEPRSGIALTAALKRVLDCSDHDLGVLSAQARRDAAAFDGQGYADEYRELIGQLSRAERGT